MNTTAFKLEGTTFIALNSLLKMMNWVESGGVANQMIVRGEVRVNGEIETRKRKKLISGDSVEFNGEQVAITR